MAATIVVLTVASKTDSIATYSVERQVDSTMALMVAKTDLLKADS